MEHTFRMGTEVRVKFGEPHACMLGRPILCFSGSQTPLYINTCYKAHRERNGSEKVFLVFSVAVLLLSWCNLHWKDSETGPDTEI